MKIRVCSDVHREMGPWELHKIENEKDMVLVLAGDIGLLKRPLTYQDFVLDLAERHRHVVWVFGNHEWYHGSWPWSGSKADDALMSANNISRGHEFQVVIDDVAFVCSTLWADFDGADPLSMRDCGQAMNDYRLIRTGPTAVDKYRRKLRTDDTLRFCRSTTKNFLTPAIKEHKLAGKKVVVVTHHAPSLQSIHETYRLDKHNGAYASDLDHLIVELRPEVWCHGHVHNSFDYTIGGTRVVCNPVGYPGERNPNFDKTLIVEV
jgi:hypothetical protein